MIHRVAAPARMRRRLTAAFLLVAAVAAGALAVGAFFLTRDARLRDSLERAAEETRRNLTLVAGLASDADLQGRVGDFQDERGVRSVAVVGDRRIASDPSVNPAFSDDLRVLVRDGKVAYERLDVRSVPYLVVGGRPPRSDVELYFFFSEEGPERDLRQLGIILGVGWGVVVLLAAIVGWIVADRALAPVAQASRAALRMAEGLLETRLPVTTRDEFGRWAASFNEMAEALGAKIRALQEARARERTFTADVSHELRTPLTALVSEAALLQTHLDRIPEPARHVAGLLIEDVARLRILAEDLMEISRLDAGAEQSIWEPLDLGQVVEATLAARGWADRVQLRVDRTTIVSDRRRIDRVVSNLIGNAMEHGGEVEVRIGADGRRAFVEVSDDGRGIAPEHLPHVFERFYKADPSRVGRGSGLGLSIARENARLLGGEIEVRSEPGAGASFTLRLPVAEPLREGDEPVS